uniref:MADS87 n=1 Tax=Hippophae rhamnoides TaxID=193516 RepID=A0AAU7LJM2_9ROSA
MAKKIELLEASQKTLTFGRVLHRRLLGHDLDSCSLWEIQEIDDQLERSFCNIRARKNQLIVEQMEKLKEKKRRRPSSIVQEEREALTYYSSPSSSASHSHVETELFIGLPHIRC